MHVAGMKSSSNSSGGCEISLTNNGVLVLYNPNIDKQVMVQVVFSMQWHGQWVARLSDGKNISPIVCFAKTKYCGKEYKIYVGHILKIIQSKLMTSDVDLSPVIDFQIPYLLIQCYSVCDPRDTLYGTSAISSINYWDCIRRVSEHLTKFDRAFQGYMEREQARIPSSSSTGDQLRQRGNSLYNDGYYESAIKCYDSASKLKLYDDRIYANQALAYIQIQNFSKGLVLSMYAIKFNPFNIKAYYRACQCSESANNLYQVFLMARACKIVCGETKDMERFQRHLTMYNANGSLDQGPIAVTIGVGARARSESSSKAHSSKLQEAASSNNSNKKVGVNDVKNKSGASVAGSGGRRSCSSAPSNVRGEQQNSEAAARESPVKSKSSKRNKNNDASKNSASSKGAAQQDKDTKLQQAAINKKIIEEEGELVSGLGDEDRVYITLLREARKLYRASSYGEAVDFYKTAFDTGLVQKRSRREQQLVSFTTNLCRVHSEDVAANVAAITELNALLQQATAAVADAAAGTVIAAAPIHYLLAMAYYRTWQPGEVSGHADECNQSLKNEKSLLPLQLPGFTDSLTQTSVDYLQEWYNEGVWRKQNVLQVLSKCRYNECEHFRGTGHHKNIVKSAGHYTGHVVLLCEESCSICYHPSCWIVVKEDMLQQEKNISGNKLNKLVDKDFLNHICLTPDCNGMIVNVTTHDESGGCKQYYNKDKLASTPTLETKQQKKKNKKKQNNTAQLNNKYKNSNSTAKENTLDEKEILEENMKKDIVPKNKNKFNPKGISKPGGVLPLDKLDFETNNIKVIKPEPLDTENIPLKNTRKRKKNQRAYHVENLLAVPPENLSLEQEYEYDEQDSEEEEGEEVPIIDIRKPFYMPRLLYENPKALDELYVEKTNPIYDFQMSPNFPSSITQEGIMALLVFMREFIAHNGPFNIDDPVLDDYMEENFPEDSIAFVKECGGLRPFLLRSRTFAIIDDRVCIKEHVLDTQTEIFNTITDKFAKNTFFTLSDHNKVLGAAIKLSRSSSSSSLLSSTQSMNNYNSNYSDASAPSSNAFSTKNWSYSNSFCTTFSGANVTVVPSSSDLNHDTAGMSVFCDSSTSVKMCDRTGTGAHSDTINIAQLDSFDDPLLKFASAKSSSTPRKKLHSTVADETGTNNTSVDLDQLFDQTCDDSECDDNDAVLTELREQVAALEESLSEAQRELEQKSSQNKSLQDKLKNTRTKLMQDVATLKKQLNDSEDTGQAHQRRAEQAKIQSAGEVRRAQAEKQKLQEENKSHISKYNALKLDTDQHVQTITALQQQLQQITMCENDMAVMAGSLSKAADRAKMAEQQYIKLNKSISEDAVRRVVEFSREEVMRLEELENYASARSVPSLSDIRLAKLKLMQHRERITKDLETLSTKSDRFMTVLSAGRPLSSLPVNTLRNLPDNLLCPISSNLISLSLGGEILVKPELEGGDRYMTSSASAAPAPNRDAQNTATKLANNFKNAVQNTANNVYGNENRQSNTGGRPGDNEMVKAAVQTMVNGQMRQALTSGGDTVVSHTNITRAADQDDFSNYRNNKSINSYAPNNLPKQHQDVCKPSNVRNSTGSSSDSGFNLTRNCSVTSFETIAPATAPANNVQNTDKANMQPRLSDLDGCIDKLPRSFTDEQLKASLHESNSRRTANPEAVIYNNPCDSTPHGKLSDFGSTGAKPKFQNSRSVAPSAGPVGSSVPNSKPIVTISSTTSTRDAVPTKNYKILVEKVKAKLGHSYSPYDVETAIMDIRRQNNNSLTGLAEDTIIKRVEQRLHPSIKRHSLTPIAPWANTLSLVTPITPPQSKINDISREECCICMIVMDKPKEVMQLDCHHYFHRACINNWLKEKSDCPICRQHTINKADYPSLKNATAN